MHGEVTARLRELHSTNEASERQRDALIHSIARGLDGWTTLVRREKAIYHTMNKLSVDVTSKVRSDEHMAVLKHMNRLFIDMASRLETTRKKMAQSPKSKFKMLDHLCGISSQDH
jgi:hypothetical protein